MTPSWTKKKNCCKAHVAALFARKPIFRTKANFKEKTATSVDDAPNMFLSIRPHTTVISATFISGDVTIRDDSEVRRSSTRGVEPVGRAAEKILKQG